MKCNITKKKQYYLKNRVNYLCDSKMQFKRVLNFMVHHLVGNKMIILCGMLINVNFYKFSRQQKLNI